MVACWAIPFWVADSWLRVLSTTEMPQIDQSVRHQLHTVVALLFELKAQQQPLEFVLPGKGAFHAEPQRVDGGIEQPLPPALRGLPIARVFLDVGNEACVEDRFAIAPGIETAIEIEI